MALKINLLFPFLLVPKCNMNSVCRPGPSHLATLMDGFPCPINSGPLACFLYVSQIHGWLYSGTVERNYSTLLTRLFGKKKKETNSPSSLEEEKCIYFEVATEIATLSLQRSALYPRFLLVQLS